MAYIEEVLKSNPVTHHRLDDTALPAADSTGGGRTITSGGGAYSTYQFRNFPMTAGSDGCMRFQQNSASDLARSNMANGYTTPLNGEDHPFSVEFWFHLDNITWTDSNSLFYSDFAINFCYRSGFRISNGMLVWGVSGEGWNYGRGYDKYFPLAEVYYGLPDLARAYHVVGVWTGAGAALYVNGEPVGSMPMNSPWIRGLNNASKAFQIPTTGSAGGAMWVENHAVYNRVLSDKEIKDHYAAGIDFPDYVSAFEADGGEIYNINDGANGVLFDKSFDVDTWTAPEAYRNVSIQADGVSLYNIEPAVAYLGGEKPYESIIGDQDANIRTYGTGGWVAENCVIYGDGGGSTVPNSTYFINANHSIYFRKTSGGPEKMRGYLAYLVTPNQTYRVHANVYHSKQARLRVSWYNNVGGLISTDYGTTQAASVSLNGPILHEVNVKAPSNAYYAEFGAENAATDAVSGDEMWIDRLYVWRDLLYSATVNDGVYVYTNQGIVYNDVGTYMGQNFSSIQGSYYVDTAVHNTSVEAVLWQLRSGDSKKVVTLRIKSNNKLAITYEYLDPYTLAWTTQETEGALSTAIGTGWHSFYTVIENDKVVVYTDTGGTSITLTNTSAASIAFDNTADIVIGNNFEYTKPWNSKLKVINIRNKPEASLTFSDTVADFTLKLSRTPQFANGNLEVSQYGYATYKIPLPDGTIASSRMNYGPQTRAVAGITATDGYHAIVRTGPDGTNWSNIRVDNDNSIPFFATNGQVLSNSTLWVRVELQTDDSSHAKVNIDRLRFKIFNSHSVVGANHGRALTVSGTVPIFGELDLHPSSYSVYNGFYANTVSGLHLDFQSNSTDASVDASGTLLGSAKTYKSIEMLFRIRSRATNQYLFYHDNGTTVYSLYYDGTVYQYTGFTSVTIYGGQATMGSAMPASPTGYYFPSQQWHYVVMSTNTAIAPIANDVGKFNFMAKSIANVATSSIGGTVKMIGLYDYVLSAADMAEHYDVLRGRNSGKLTDTVAATLSEPNSPDRFVNVSGTWGYKQISVDQQPDSA